MQDIKNNCSNLGRKFKKSIYSSLCAVLLCASNYSLALDVVIIIDTTGSTGALLPTWRANMETAIIQPIQAVDPNARFALVSHLDFPFTPFGGAGEYAYRVEAPLNTNTVPLLNALNSLTTGVGGDTKESQYEAIYQANTGLGLDLNGNGSFTDPGDIVPNPLGFNPITNSFTIHFTAPLDFHNDPFEPNYPFAGVVNNPAGEAEAIAAMNSQNNTYFTFVPTALTARSLDGREIKAGVMDMQSGTLLKSREDSTIAMRSSSAERLAEATGGEVIPLKVDFSNIREVMSRVIDVVRPCPEGSTPVELPFGVVCVPTPSASREVISK